MKRLMANARKVLPILVENCDLPHFLRGKLYADFRRLDDYKQQLDSLLKSLGLNVDLEINKSFEPETILDTQGLFPHG